MKLYKSYKKPHPSIRLRDDSGYFHEKVRNVKGRRGDRSTKTGGYDPTSMRTLGEPVVGSVQIGVQPEVLPSRDAWFNIIME